MSHDRRCAARRASALASAVLWAAVLGCGESPPTPPEPVRPIKVLVVGDASASGRREYPATLSPATDAMLGFEVPGRIVDLPVTEGQAVEAGTVLARLDARDYDAKLSAAQAGTRKAEADLRRALAVRAEDAGAISMAMIDMYRRAVDVSHAEQTIAEKAREDATLRAPFTGRVARRLVDDFANVQAKEPIVNLQDTSFIRAVVDLPERDVVGLQPTGKGREALTALFAPAVSIPSHSDRPYPAEVWEFATTADPSTRTFTLTLRFVAPEGVVLLPGMTGRVTLASRGALTGAGSLRVPAGAVVTAPDRTAYVWIVEPNAMTVQRRAVRLGRIVSDEVEVLDGLRAGETIATAGVQQLRDGMQVRRLEP